MRSIAHPQDWRTNSDLEDAMSTHALPQKELYSPAPPQADTAKGAVPVPSVTTASDHAALAAIVPAWEELAANAVEANPLYEPWMLLPCIEEGASNFVCALAWGQGGRRLDGLFPFERLPRFDGLPVRGLRSWYGASWRLCTPLVRRDSAAQALASLLAWLESGGSCVTEFRYLPSNGAFRGLLADALRDRSVTVITADTFTRPMLVREADGRRPFDPGLSGETGRKLRRKERRLGERGALTHVALGADGDIERWIDELLHLEAASWRSRRGLGLASSQASRRVASAVLTSAFRRGRLQMVGIDLDGRPLARRCTVLAGEGAYAFGAAYNHDFAKFSPGVLAEADSIRAFERLAGTQWMDAVTDPDGNSINRLWRHRRVMQSVVVGTGMWGEMWASLLYILRRREPRFSTPERKPTKDRAKA